MIHAAGSQDAVLAFLSDPAVHGGEVERIDTHGASVFLTKERAYKLKRAVRYSYLDFSTAERRRLMCQRELQLNRRTAPELYLDVVPIVPTLQGTLAFGDAKTPPASALDWVVVMRRFADDALFSTMVQEGRLEPSHVRDLADRLFAFHESAATPIEDDGVARVRRVIEGNRDSMAATQPELLAPDDCDRLLTMSLARLSEVSRILGARAANGCVRHCHGDLHLANVCLWNGKATAFDCLEFDDELATCDLLYDLAFAVMDLWHRREGGLASLLFNRYFDMADLDAEALGVLPLFLSMRAAIRAHVHATQAGQAKDARKSEEHGREAKCYLEDALQFLAPSAPRLVAVGGLSGTGKSTLAGQLAPAMPGAVGARWLRTDVLRKRMAGVSPEVRLPAESYTPEMSDKVYAAILAKAGDALRSGSSVLIDGIFVRPQERAVLGELARDCGATFRGLWLEAPIEVLRKRVSGRSGDASDATVDVLERQSGFDTGDLSNWQRVDASGSHEQVLSRALDALGLG
ncbi:AAA family ATPase [Novosphingobium profundi]|uniref:bifunctional aminoglycoside phosphotransferase/ATP-binding protein n=1 Tax=Novosphingobium profundi TaxID=1774954 RepID=UPI001BD93206|nr:bifunctional aminoglycoside phosphotransferase/ATP-binding protein [Novosphingobium profundi]MBT0671387.1 AAA family ATPase [Novosphingobium profundi]